MNFETNGTPYHLTFVVYGILKAIIVESFVKCTSAYTQALVILPTIELLFGPFQASVDSLCKYNYTFVFPTT